MLDKATQRKLDNLQGVLKELNGVVVAFSGGVDSTFLTYIAQRTLGKRALAVTGCSVTLAKSEFKEAIKLARRIGIRHRIVKTTEILIKSYKKNPTTRCYYCKNELYTRLRAIAADENLPHIIDGSNADDSCDFRPGMKAARELRIRSPLIEAGFTKAEIREMSKKLGLPTWDKPAMPCLSSRIPYGEKITVEKIYQVEKAESSLHSLGFKHLRIRHHGPIARIEIPRGEFPRLFSESMTEKVVHFIKEAGFTYVSLDLEGFRSGSLNESNSPQKPLPMALLP